MSKCATRQVLRFLSLSYTLKKILFFPIDDSPKENDVFAGTVLPQKPASDNRMLR